MFSFQTLIRLDQEVVKQVRTPPIETDADTGVAFPTNIGRGEKEIKVEINHKVTLPFQDAPEECAPGEEER